MRIGKSPFLLAAGLLAASSASAAIVIDTVFVGDAGNANDTTGLGAVTYDYYIGTHEVTNSQYTAFLNAVAATDTYSLYNSNMDSSTHGGITQAGSSGSYTYSVKSGFENKPVNFVSFWDAARFTNWLTSGDTENGVYVLTPTGISNNTITRDATAFNNGGVAIASEDEWYKAAYYDGSSYFDYPTQSNTAPTIVAPGSATGSNNANYDGAVGTVTDVGAYPNSASHYGTFDQGGNVWERNDAVVFPNSRGLRGGSFQATGIGYGLQSSDRDGTNPAFEEPFIGFRVSSPAPIPEPSAYAAVLGCLGLGLALTRRKGRVTV
jgi:formylglycine-generating enzyme required for sulfatase activity